MKPIIIYSGGLDSTVLLYHLVEQGWAPRALSFDYGQRHRKELTAASQICRNIGVDYRVVGLTGLKGVFGSNALTDSSVDVPEGTYKEENLRATVVPNRNMIMLSIAIARAIAVGCDTVAYAAHKGDHVIYPDCRPAFATVMDLAAQLCSFESIRLHSPFIDMTKTEIVRLGSKLRVPFRSTWSCYQGGEVHCGRCGTCRERRQAFERAGVKDPTVYEE